MASKSVFLVPTLPHKTGKLSALSVPLTTPFARPSSKPPSHPSSGLRLFFALSTSSTCFSPLPFSTKHLLFGFSPIYSHLRVFGCLCYPNTSPTTPHKLAPRSSACVYLGPSTDHRGYHCLVLIMQKVIISRHVVFDETHFPFPDFQPRPTSEDYDSFDINESLPSFSPIVDTSSPPPDVGPSRGVQKIRIRSDIRIHENFRPENIRKFGYPDFRIRILKMTFYPIFRNFGIFGLSGIRIRNFGYPNFRISGISDSDSDSPSVSVSSSQPPSAEPSGASSTPSTLAGTSGHLMTTCSRIGSLKPKQIFNLSVTSDISSIPQYTAQAMGDPHWWDAMDAEMAALLSNYTWDLVSKPFDVNIIGSRWLYRHKFYSNGRLERYKGRLVAQGFSQQPFDNTFSLVVKPATIRMVLSIYISRNWPIHQLDVKNAFLHGDLTETVYMRQPPGYIDSVFPDHVCRLRKALYGLKQAPRAWYQPFVVYLSSLGFLSSKTNTSLFTYHRRSDTIYLLFYVDDIILTASSHTLISMVISQLSSEFPMSDLGLLFFFLGIAASRSKSGLFLSQSGLCSGDFSMSLYGLVTPANTKTKLAANDEPYLTFARPDIAYVVQQVCLFMHDPRLPYFNALKCILQFLKGTLSHGLHIKA
ncbi:LOW QUALITY PROTEIN: hypothetical protein OSB04_019453 [Centaurea solstitialis]|uniref:Reverse transcriptase Ty1/copia-type domain-containing protein n=1 Tax=Centaurea solstitialis TaxID=347529 RepID=A0AA38T2N0_9ASTR|nr:LOW QUALITY PROTEIN: hypothetical protein OSB04_019453 [Centaurea solstitialis]